MRGHARRKAVGNQGTARFGVGSRTSLSRALASTAADSGSCGF